MLRHHTEVQQSTTTQVKGKKATQKKKRQYITPTIDHIPEQNRVTAVYVKFTSKPAIKIKVKKKKRIAQMEDLSVRVIFSTIEEWQYNASYSQRRIQSM